MAEATFAYPQRIKLDAKGNLYVLDGGDFWATPRKIDFAANRVSTVIHGMDAARRAWQDPACEPLYGAGDYLVLAIQRYGRWFFLSPLK